MLVTLSPSSPIRGLLSLAILTEMVGAVTVISLPPNFQNSRRTLSAPPVGLGIVRNVSAPNQIGRTIAQAANVVF